ncbi:FRG domain-containing protein [Erythrobacter sp. W53]|uniref:FRG domain-containing protein n=1 Tax=Erythrobacter sp. W53 TaxID=3425947 RepID=UPI003D769C09
MPINPTEGMPKARELARVENIADTLEAINRLTDSSDTFNCFRGHGSVTWLPFPSIFRQSTRVTNSESLMVRDLVSRYPDQFINDASMFDRLVRMQHFGLPTRLLDVTSNPLVGLYFAAADCADEDGSLVIFRISSARKKYYDSDSVSCVCNLANLKLFEKESIETTTATTISAFMRINAAQRLYQFIREEKPHFRPELQKNDLFRQFYVVAKQNNPRIIAQNGAFLAFGLRHDDASSFRDEISSFSLRIPASHKKAILRELSSIGINAGTLFPEIDRAASQIVASYS